MQIIEIRDNFYDKEIIKTLLKKKTCLIGVFSESCFHCKNMEAEWNILKKKIKKIKCDNILLQIDANQLQNIDFNTLKKSVNGFPTIIIYKKGKKIKEYNGNRTANDMLKFFKPYIELKNKTIKRNKIKGKGKGKETRKYKK